MQEDVIQRLQVDRIREAHEEESWVRVLKAYLKGGWDEL